MNETNTKISGVMLNMYRPQYVRRAIEHYLRLDIFSEFWVVNCNPAKKFVFPNKRVRVLNLSEDIGLYARFMVAPFCENPCVFHSDEDVIWPHKTCVKMFKAWAGSPDSIHGTVGRHASAKYTTENIFGNVEIVLTGGGVLTSRSTSMDCLSAMRNFLDMKTEPFGNGEDIVLSYAAIARAGVLNSAYRVDTNKVLKDAANFSEVGYHAIGKRCKNHRAHRGRVVKRCKEIYKDVITVAHQNSAQGNCS